MVRLKMTMAWFMHKAFLFNLEGPLSVKTQVLGLEIMVQKYYASYYGTRSVVYM